MICARVDVRPRRPVRSVTAAVAAPVVVVTVAIMTRMMMMMMTGWKMDSGRSFVLLVQAECSIARENYQHNVWLAEQNAMSDDYSSDDNNNFEGDEGNNNNNNNEDVDDKDVIVDDDEVGDGLLLLRYIQDSLPPGIDYNLRTDTLKCRTAQACQNWTISGCTAVYCREYQACRNVQFLAGNMAIACWGRGACYGASFKYAHDVSCGAGYAQSCANAVIQTNDQLWCYGPQACVNPPPSSSTTTTTTTTARVGPKGTVRCANGNGEWSCQNMIVEVSHGRRACFGTEQDPQQCAVLCATEYDCDQSTIQFRIQ